MKKKVLLMAGVLALTLCSACGKTADTQKQNSQEEAEEGKLSEEVSGKDDSEEELSGEKGLPEETVETEGVSEEKDLPDEKESGDQETEQQPSAEPKEEFSLQDLSDYVFEFSSGVGAWSTDLRIYENGTFKGHYRDADMGDTGEGYADGTLYVCSFTGKFGGLEKVDDFTYKMKLESLTFEEEPNKEEIIDNVRNVYSTAYGIDDGEDFYLYLPGAEFSGLPESYRGWVNNFYEWVKDSYEEGKLPFYGLYNEKTGDGFSSYEYKEKSLSEEIAREISIAENFEKDWKERQKEDASQSEMNMASAELYQNWDNALNIVWKWLESELDDATMEQLRAEEREWIKFKESEVKAAGKEMEGGSMQPLLESEKATELTKKRIYELAKYAE